MPPLQQTLVSIDFNDMETFRAIEKHLRRIADALDGTQAANTEIVRQMREQKKPGE